MLGKRTPFLFTVAILLIPLVFFGRALFGGQAFVPADLTAEILPWRSLRSNSELAQTPWNVLRFDGAAQFYPWRLETARQWRSGEVPLVNPYQFAHEGGMPLLANSQSAPFYPPNLLFALFVGEFFWYAFGLSAALHLLFLLTGMVRFLRSLGLTPAAAFFGAATFGLSAPVVCWLALPTFLCVAAWFPWLLLALRDIHFAKTAKTRRIALVTASFTAGMMLLAGHLQIAFYGLLMAGLYALFLAVSANGSTKTDPIKWLGGTFVVLALTVGLAAPQLFPALELSRVSHRASSGFPTGAMYFAYLSNALPVRNIALFVAPKLFGMPSDGTYWNDLPFGNNFAEWSPYIGLLPLLLAILAVSLSWGKNGLALPPERAFFALLALLALLMAFGTPANAPFFFLVPGWAQTGNPARILILWAFSASILAAIGLDSLSHEARRIKFFAFIAPIFALAIGIAAAKQFVAIHFAQVDFGTLLLQPSNGLTQFTVFFALGIGTLFAHRLLPAHRHAFIAPFAGLIMVADLLVFGLNYNPTTTPDLVYPKTEGIQWLQQNAPSDLIAFVNIRWSMTAQTPQTALMPPNTATVYGLHDLAGYDSLIPKAFKERIKNSGETDPSPLENGNMVFIKSPEIAEKLQARYIVLPPGSIAANRTAVYRGGDMEIYENQRGRKFIPNTAPWPLSFRIGLTFGAVSLLVMIVVGVASLRELPQSPPLPLHGDESPSPNG